MCPGGDWYDLVDPPAEDEEDEVLLRLVIEPEEIVRPLLCCRRGGMALMVSRKDMMTDRDVVLVVGAATKLWIWEEIRHSLLWVAVVMG